MQREGRYSLLPFRRCKAAIGLFGGSFNPPHEGHYYVAQQMQKRIPLKMIYWLVSPQNPRKQAYAENNLNHRYKQVASFVNDRRHPYGTMKFSKIEENFRSSFTVETIKQLCRMHPDSKFVWIIGADNFSQLHFWHKWQHILKQVHLCVVDRDGVNMNFSFNRKVRSLYPICKITNQAAKVNLLPNSWSFYKLKKIPVSSSQIRQQSEN
jgi:nicotinate-nucleotide adenylyltransferase